MAIGIALRCKEEMEIINLKVHFHEGRKYLCVPQTDGIYVVDEKHTPVLIPDKLLMRHFEQV